MPTSAGIGDIDDESWYGLNLVECDDKSQHTPTILHVVAKCCDRLTEPLPFNKMLHDVRTCCVQFDSRQILTQHFVTGVAMFDQGLRKIW